MLGVERLGQFARLMFHSSQNRPMRLSTFISANLDPILIDWVAFARTQWPPGARMDEAALLDHGKLILQEIAADMHRPQDDAEQRAKSEGNSATASTSENVPSRSHARQRERQGFEMEQMAAEYRALRATVLRRWSASSNELHVQDLEDVTRFNEAVDQAMAESLRVFVTEVDRTRDLFLGMLGHDLRGPLSTIATCATLTLREHPEDPGRSELVLRSVAQMRSLLDDLVEYTRHRLGAGLTIEPSHLLLDQFARNTLDEIAAISAEHELILDSTGTMEGEGDARRLHQALSNLVFNALKYGFKGSAVRVVLNGTRDEEVTIQVHNSGKPIPASLLPKLFDPLVRAGDDEADADSQVAGANLGLGLYVVREIANAHGGTVEVSSDKTATCFELQLPRICARRILSDA
jgi:signal transduction histidine kinase